MARCPIRLDVRYNLIFNNITYIIQYNNFDFYLTFSSLTCLVIYFDL